MANDAGLDTAGVKLSEKEIFLSHNRKLFLLYLFKKNYLSQFVINT